MTDLKQVTSSCHLVLLDLEKLMDKYGELETCGGSIRKKVKRVWKSLKWEPEDIQELRSRLVSNITLLNTLMGQISR